jgi:hypothetical protein
VLPRGFIIRGNMKELTKEEFADRAQAIANARKIFVPHFTRNISIAFEIYQEMLAEQKRKIVLEKERSRDYGPLEGLIRPMCPDCEIEMHLRLITCKHGPKNRFGWRSSWMCPNDECCYETFSKKDLQGWIDTLEKKEEQDGS